MKRPLSRKNCNEKIGQKDRAQLTLLNPQIINGGQTAYTLSQIYKDNISGDLEAIFGQKEVLVKIITFDSTQQLTEQMKLSLIEAISKATNSQTAVTNADRRSNEPDLQALQKRSFEFLGIFLERKRGEFADGVREGYLDSDTVVDKNIFLRAAMIVQGRLRDAAARKLAARCDYQAVLEVSDTVFLDYKLAFTLLKATGGAKKYPGQTRLMDRVAKTYICLLLARHRNLGSDSEIKAVQAVAYEVRAKWFSFLRFCKQRRTILSSETDRERFYFQRYLESAEVEVDVKEFFLEADDAPQMETPDQNR